MQNHVKEFMTAFPGGYTVDDILGDRKIAANVEVKIRELMKDRLYAQSEHDSLWNDFYIAILRAMADFKPAMNCQPATYLDKVIWRQKIDLLRKRSSERRAMKMTVPLEDVISGDNDASSANTKIKHRLAVDTNSRKEDFERGIREFLAILSENERHICKALCETGTVDGAASLVKKPASTIRWTIKNKLLPCALKAGLGSFKGGTI